MVSLSVRPLDRSAAARNLRMLLPRYGGCQHLPHLPGLPGEAGLLARRRGRCHRVRLHAHGLPARRVLRGAAAGGSGRGGRGGILAPAAAEHYVGYLELDALRRRRGLALVHYHAASPPVTDKVLKFVDCLVIIQLIQRLAKIKIS